MGAGSCEYLALDEGALLITVQGVARRLEVDDVVVCAGQLSHDALFKQLSNDETQPTAFVIGGAHKAGELDAKRAIDQGYRLAAQIETAPAGSVFEMPSNWQADALRVLRDAFGKNSA